MRALAVVPLLVAPLVAPVLPVSADAAPRTDLASALEVLHAWDARRAEAWAASDGGALRALYVRGSRAGSADARLLGAYEARGVVVRRLVTQVFAVRLLRHDASTLRLRVFDRVAGGETVRDGHTQALPSSLPATRVVTFRLVRGSWLVEGISGLS